VKIIIWTIFAVALVNARSFAEDTHDHAPGHCEWCDRHTERGEVTPSKPASLRSQIQMPEESSPIGLVLLIAGLGSAALGISARSYLQRAEKTA